MLSPSENRTEDKRHSALIPGLELTRGLASLQVFFGHFIPLFVLGDVASYAVRPFWIDAFLTWTGEAVLVFFVLSGLVIAISQRNQSRDRIHFMRARLRRLAPLYLIAILLAQVVDCIMTHRLFLKPLWGHLLFMQSGLQSAVVKSAPLYATNLPLWSLSFEFYFYLLFSLTIGTRFPWMRSALWVIGFAFMALIHFGYQPVGFSGHLQTIAAYMPIWLLGVTLISKPIYFRPSLGQNLVLFSIMFLVARSYYSDTFYAPDRNFILALFIAPLLYSLANSHKTADPGSHIWSWVIVGLIYLGAAAMMLLNVPNPASYPYWTTNYFLLLVPVITGLAALLLSDSTFSRIGASAVLQKASLFLGRISYALYVIHWPICLLVRSHTHNIALRVILDLGIVVPLACFLEYRVHPYLCRIFDRIWPNTPYKPAASLSRQQTCSI